MMGWPEFLLFVMKLCLVFLALCAVTAVIENWGEIKRRAERRSNRRWIQKIERVAQRIKDGDENVVK
jgi:hypothetical protein